MKFIKKKNLLEGEELLYKPSLHWMYAIRHIIYSLPFFLFIVILWLATDSFFTSSEWVQGLGSAFLIKTLLKNVFLLALFVVLLIFICRIFLYLSYEFGVTNKRLIIKKGIIRLVIAEIPTDRIESIYCIQGILGRIFRYGTIYISGIGGMKPVFFMVSRPFVLRRKIASIIEKNKTITVVHGELPKPRTAVKPEMLEDEPVYRYGSFVRVISGPGSNR